jgi:hypothetical protein
MNDTQYLVETDCSASTIQYTQTQDSEQTGWGEESNACKFNDDRKICIGSKATHNSGLIFSFPDLIHHFNPNKALCIPMRLDLLDRREKRVSDQRKSTELFHELYLIPADKRTEN